MDRPTNFSKEFKAARVQLGYTQAEIAAALNVEQATVSRWERGAEPTIEKLALIGKFFEQKNVRFEYMWSILRDAVQEQMREQRTFVPLFGYVQENGAVEEVEMDSTSDIEAPPSAQSSTMCVILKTNDYAPLIRINSVFYFNGFEDGTHSKPGLLAICKTRDGYLVGERYPGSSGNLHTIRLARGIAEDIEVSASTPFFACRMR